MTLNCLGPHNTRHSAPLSLQRPEVKCSRVTGAGARRMGLLFKFVISNWTSERNWLWQGEPGPLSTFYIFTGNLDPLNAGEWCLYTHIYFAVLQYGDNCTIVLNPILCEWKQLSKGSYFVQEEPIPPSHAPEPAINRNYISSFDSAELNIWFYFYDSTLEWQARK